MPSSSGSSTRQDELREPLLAAADNNNNSQPQEPPKPIISEEASSSMSNNNSNNHDSTAIMMNDDAPPPPAGSEQELAAPVSILRRPAPPPPATTTHNEANHNKSSCCVLSPIQVMAMLSNYSTSYNVVNISMVLPILEQLIPDTSNEDKAASASSLLAGMMVGQLVGGYLGDSPVLGRMGALQLVMALQVVASLGSAICLQTSHKDFYVLLAVFRFLLGVGAGGVYPLAAVLSAEEQPEEEDETEHQDSGAGHHYHHGPTQPQGSTTSMNHNEDEEVEEDVDAAEQRQIRRVVLTFSTQGLGFITAPLVTVPLLYATTNLNLIWRILLGLGSLPGIVLLGMQLWMRRRQSAARRRHYPIPQRVTSPEDDEDADAGEAPVVESAIVQQQQDEDNNNNHRDDIEDRHQGDGPVGEHENTNDAVTEEILLRNMQIMEEQLTTTTGGRWDAIRHEPNLIRKMLGTAGTWFLFDVMFYGNTLFQPVVIDAAFGKSSNHGGDDDPIHELREDAINSLILTSIALPGYAVAGFVMGKKCCCILQTPKYVMLQGFGAMSVLYFAIGDNWSALRRTPALLVLLYGMYYVMITFVIALFVCEKATH